MITLIGYGDVHRPACHAGVHVRHVCLFDLAVEVVDSFIHSTFATPSVRWRQADKGMAPSGQIIGDGAMDILEVGKRAARDWLRET